MENIYPLDFEPLWANPQAGVVLSTGEPGISPPADPSRRVLIMSANGLSDCFVFPRGLFASPGGIHLPATDPTIVLTWEEHGPLVTLAYQCSPSSEGHVYWLAASMPQNPEDAGWQNVYAKRSLSFGRRNGVYTPRFTPRPLSAADGETVRRLLEKYKP